MRTIPLTRAAAILALAAGIAACGNGAADPATTMMSSTTTVAPTGSEPPATDTAPQPTEAVATTTAATTSTTSTTAVPVATVIDVGVSGGSVEGPPRPAVSRGEEVVIVVTADSADEVHVHGYDLFADVAPGVPAEISFIADIPGIFEVELESSHVLLFELRVE